MMVNGWQHDDSPFHEGEQQVQERLGVRDAMEKFARRVIRDHLPEQHRDFYESLQLIALGTVDTKGRPWASIMAGRKGFMTSPDAGTLEIAGQPLFGDPLKDTLKAGAPVGVLGIELETRRRNRISGRIRDVSPQGIIVTVDQAFGNCPQYIQRRSVEALPEIDDNLQRRSVYRSSAIDARARKLIERSDTFFIATAYSDGTETRSQGADVSHRGGKPGFVRIEDEQHLMFPDFSGNNHFNTIGNIFVNPKTGLLFVDFEAGDLLYLTGEAEIVWDGENVRAFDGAERFVRFRSSEVIRAECSLPLRFDFRDYSPVLEHTGSWGQAAETIRIERERITFVPFEVFDIRPESETVTSFYLRRIDGHDLAPHQPGQFLPIRFRMPGEDIPVVRTYTVSDKADGRSLRISVKREGLASTFLHDHIKPGFHIEALAPRGQFALDSDGHRPVVLVSAGVGITPMIAMANHIMARSQGSEDPRRVVFVHGARNGGTLAFAGHLRNLAKDHPNLSLHIRLSQPGPKDRIGVTHDSVGHVDIPLLKRLLNFDDHEFYLCGPRPFMEALYQGLVELGVREDRIHYEYFGPATVLKGDRPSQTGESSSKHTDESVPVRFSTSDVDTLWSPAEGTILELAEKAGLAPPFACRSGVCGTCAARIQCGHVDYVEEPSAPHNTDEVLICRAVPRTGTDGTGCGEDPGLVIEL